MSDASRQAVFLDRDGVINRKAPEGDYVKSWAEFEFLPTVLEALVGSGLTELAAALKGSAMRRAKVSGLRRNIDVVLRNKDVAAIGRLRHT